VIPSAPRSYGSARVALLLAIPLAACAHAPKRKGPAPPLERLTPAARAEAIARAQVWMPTEVSSKDLYAGPQGAGSFTAGQEVACDFTPREATGHSPKFYCTIKPEDTVKVKYGADNGETYGEVAATRLFWALGFGADHNYSVNVRCRGCPPDPWRERRRVSGERVFNPANIERKLAGAVMETRPDSGWKWPELDSVDESRGGATRAQRDAFKLLAVMLQHTDNKAPQQRLICLPGGVQKQANGDEVCTKPFMMVNDLGLTFGRANLFNRNGVGSVHFDKWSTLPVWKDPGRCVGQLKKSLTGTLKHPVISEAGRKFLADLLVQLTDGQIRDLFSAARFDLRLPRRPRPGKPRPTIDDWVQAFKAKRDQIVNHTCPS
jgi:hypothetical protein